MKMFGFFALKHAKSYKPVWFLLTMIIIVQRPPHKPWKSSTGVLNLEPALVELPALGRAPLI